MIQNSVEGKTALITGGGSGIGLAITRRFHQLGMRVIVASRRVELLDSVVAELNDDGRQCAVAIEMDVRQRKSVAAAIAALPENSNRIDVLVNNAGLGVEATLQDCSDADWDLVIDTTLKGPFLVTQAVLPGMRQQGGGLVLNVASQAAKHGYANAGPYCAAKFGLVGFAKALQEEVRDDGIRVHNLMPGLVQVPAPGDGEHRKPGWLQTSDLADAAEYVVTRPGRVFLEDIGLVGQ